jgi:hypothetical protein
MEIDINIFNKYENKYQHILQSNPNIRNTKIKLG